METNPEFINDVISETEILQKALEDHGVKVHIAREASEEEIKYLGRGSESFSQVFAAEPIWVVGRNVLENA